MRINYRELRKMYAAMERRAFCQQLRESLQKKEIDAGAFSLKEAAEEFVVDRNGEVCGREWVRLLESDSFMEAGADAVSTSMFADISGQIVYTEILDSYQNPAFIGSQLCTEVQTKFDGEKIAGINQIGDKSQIVDEGMPFPHVGVSQDYIETPRTTKRGLIVPITKEAIFFDRTGVLLDRCREVGKSLGWNKEKQIIDMATGTASTFETGGRYKWRGTEYAQYQTSTPWINSVGNTLVDWTDIEVAELMFDKMTDPGTGEPILLEAKALLVPSALLYTARRILSATEIVHEGATNATHYASKFQNPVPSYGIVSSPLVYARTSSASKWWFGDFKQAFQWRYNWPMTVVQAPANNQDEFNRDIVVQFKASERGTCAVREPRAVTENT